jgi:hypothetical protein
MKTILTCYFKQQTTPGTQADHWQFAADAVATSAFDLSTFRRLLFRLSVSV